MSECVRCDGCVEVCPEVFRYNGSGYVEVIELEDYPADCVDEAIMICPADCIYWRQTESS